MSKVKDDLKATNEFQSNLSSFNQEETSLFDFIITKETEKFSFFEYFTLFFTFKNELINKIFYFV
jgi:hypothetical protein